MATTLPTVSTLLAQAKEARDAYWVLLDQVQADLAPRLAGLFEAIGLVKIESYVNTDAEPETAIEVTWSRVWEGDEEATVETMTLLHKNVLEYLLDRKEDLFASGAAPEGFETELAAAAEAQGLDLKVVMEHLYEHNELILLEDGEVTIKEDQN